MCFKAACTDLRHLQREKSTCAFSNFHSVLATYHNKTREALHCSDVFKMWWSTPGRTIVFQGQYVCRERIGSDMDLLSLDDKGLVLDQVLRKTLLANNIWEHFQHHKVKSRSLMSHLVPGATLLGDIILWAIITEKLIKLSSCSVMK